MRRSTCWYLIRSDVYRISGRADAATVAKMWLTRPVFRYLVNLRVGRWARSGRRPITRLVTAFVYHRQSYRLGLEIPFSVAIGPGLRINHRAGGVVINPRARIGANVTLTPGVVIGNNAPDPTAPIIGDCAIVNVGAKIIGPISVGDRCQVGAGAVVIRDVPDDTVVAGVPARPIPSAQARDMGLEALFEAVGPQPADTL